MIAVVLGTVFVVACLIWAAAWGVQIVAIIARVILGVLGLLVAPVAVLIGSLAWMVWFCFAPKPAMASVRKAQAEYRAGKLNKAARHG